MTVYRSRHLKKSLFQLFGFWYACVVKRLPFGLQKATYSDGSVQQHAGDGNTQGSPLGRFAWPRVFSSPAFNSLPVGKLTSKITLPLTKQDRKSN